MDDIDQNQVEAFAKDLGPELQSMLERKGMESFELESIVLKKKEDVKTMGLLPGCELKCEVTGFPPRLECRVFCG
ncbi:hypothetical protein EOJ32_19850 (plasmid) [Paracoccus sp. Arc7-R13]|uniref:hypothetical protein n=1 Tax=Paracoccus sp. Arc7-R13 TaxID=2500532 RepID=UPI000FDBAC72|nr:hypothetical protein [Paracoccus sp. Arc7-R13]AZY96047.1 hypothetical protein EOJ32_19850 [Paracoccus sp. Arc7-R13]